MEKMFCFQCEQTVKKKSEGNEMGGCTVSGVCGKNPIVSSAQDELVCEMISLATIVEKTGKEKDLAVEKIADGLFTTLTNVNFDESGILKLANEIKDITKKLGGKKVIEQKDLFHGESNLISLRSTLLFGLRGMGAYAHHARILGKRDKDVDSWFIKGMASMVKEQSVDEWLSLIMEFGEINLKCMHILDEANTSNYGNPIPTKVPLSIEKGPFIVVTGHDLHDLKMLLEQTDGKGINVYTHGEMLPAHGYPELKKHKQLKGNFGTAWQNQQNEFDKIPAPILFTTNCIMAPKKSYADRVYTTSVVAYPDLKYISSNKKGYKDFSDIIKHALELEGYKEDVKRTGINKGETVTTGFGRKTILDNAPTIIDAVKNGAIKHFFLIGGCDGSKTGRNYYTEFAKQTPDDTIILTLACGKYRINDLELGNIGPFPRILDVGQCNDAYGAIEVALALANAFNCSVNELPLTLVLSWYEQKAVCILLTLLSLGIKNIYIGPSIPAFFSDDVLKVLIEKFNLHPIGDPKKDLASILKTN